MKRKFKYKVAQFFNYYFQTHFLESESERVVFEYLEQYFPVQKQIKIGPYRVDFVVNDLIIVEVDGPFHKHQKEYDEARDIYLTRIQIYKKVIRIVSDGLWTQERSLILEKLYKEILKFTK